MKHFVALLVAFFATTLPAHAALNYDGYPTGPGGYSTPYPAGDNPGVFAGLIEVNYGGNPVLMMSDDYSTRLNVGDSWDMHLYTYAEVMAGAPVKFAPEQYARAAWVLDSYFSMGSLPNSAITTFAGLYGNDVLATLNTQVWGMMSSNECPLAIFPGGCSGVDTSNWSDSMLVASGVDEYLIPINTVEAGLVSIGNATIPSIPEPRSSFLFLSGLLLVGYVARRKSLQEARIK